MPKVARKKTNQASNTEPIRRFVRLESSTYIADILKARNSGSEYLLQSSAAIEQERAISRVKLYSDQEKPGAAQNQRVFASQYAMKIHNALHGTEEQKRVLMQRHATSSAKSPYLSGTPSFTTGENSQFTYMVNNLRGGSEQTVTIHSTGRAVVNPLNSREKELLMTGGERRDEVVGMLHVPRPSGGDTDLKVKPMFVDLSGVKPKLFLGSHAVSRFKELSQK